MFAYNNCNNCELSHVRRYIKYNKYLNIIKFQYILTYIILDYIFLIKRGLG